MGLFEKMEKDRESVGGGLVFGLIYGGALPIFASLWDFFLGIQPTSAFQKIWLAGIFFCATYILYDAKKEDADSILIFHASALVTYGVLGSIIIFFAPTYALYTVLIGTSVSLGRCARAAVEEQSRN